MTIPANSIQDTLMLVDDGSTGDSLGCSPLINDLTGKIAVIYRGVCEFGVKAKNAQDAGAVGAIIINKAPGVLQMGPGAQGANVIIPTVMISDADGAIIRAAMNAGDVVVFIGSKNGLYANDLSLSAFGAITSRATANPKLISANATEWNVPMGAWVYNYGNQPQTNVTLTANITGGASFSASSSPAVNIPVNDSAYLSVGTYSAASYSGLYKINYVAGTGTADDFPGDNGLYSNFLIDSLFSYGLIDSVTKLPKVQAHFSTNTQPGDSIDFKTCIHFRDANASRLAAKGLYFSAYNQPQTAPPTDLTGETVYTELFEWNDVFTGLSDPAFPASPWNLNQVAGGSYTFGSNLVGTMIYVPFTTPKILTDNQRYLFCVWHSKVVDGINLGFDTHFDYTNALDSTDQPISIVMEGSGQFATGFGPDATANIAAKFGVGILSVGEHNNSFDVTPYPNPTTSFIIIPLKGLNGNAKLDIMDLTGKIVSTQTVKVAETVSVNVKDVPGGNYIFSMLFENGKSTTFKVVITK